MNARPAQLQRLQARVFALTWIAYAAHYLSRKNFAVTKTSSPSAGSPIASPRTAPASSPPSSSPSRPRAASLFLYKFVDDGGLLINATAMELVGFLLFGPDALISGAVAQDIGGPNAAAAAAGIINGLGASAIMLLLALREQRT